jgi:RNA polymerase sigma-70 factor (ECF subfamily)
MSAESRTHETALVRSAQAGDRAAFGVLYQQYRPLVHGILLSHVDYHQAEDLMQDTFVKALEQLPALRERVTFGAWLTAIARHVAIDHHRRRKLEPLGEEQAGARSPDFEAFAVLDVIKGLPESYRETLVLRLVEGMTGPEIALRTGLTADSVRVNLCRGMKLLRGRLEKKQ